MHTSTRTSTQVRFTLDPGEFVKGDRAVTRFVIHVASTGRGAPQAWVTDAVARERKRDGDWGARDTWVSLDWADLPESAKAAAVIVYQQHMRSIGQHVDLESFVH